VSEKSRLLVHGVDVLVGGRLVPLVPARPKLSSSSVAWEGIALEVHSTPPCDHPYHEHPTHFIQLQLRGPAMYEWSAGGRMQTATAVPGTIFILPRGSFDRVQWTSPTDRIALSLHPQLLTHVLEETSHLEDVEIRPNFGLKDRHIESLLLALRSDLEDGSPAGPLYGESIAIALAVYLQKRYGVLAPKTTQYCGGMPGIRLNRVLEYIRANIGEDLRLSALAQTAGMSAHYFGELFKQSTGVSPHQYVLRARIERAKEHLRDSRVSVVEASAITGFVDQSYFTKAFRRVVGVTPTEFRASASPGKRGPQSRGETKAGTSSTVSGIPIGGVEMKKAPSSKPPETNETSEPTIVQQTEKESAPKMVNGIVEPAPNKNDWSQAVIQEVNRLLEARRLTDASREILNHAMKPTQSEFGFVGLVLDGGLLRLLVHSGFKWHETTNREFYESKMQSYAENGYLDFDESSNLIAAVVTQKNPVLTNLPAQDPRSGGVPTGHPALHSFLGVPAVEGSEARGMIGMANRPNGFTQAELDLVESLIPALVDLYHSYRRMEREGTLKMSLIGRQCCFAAPPYKI
jgi:AraC family transcriptional regulator